jgi:hypothetical protein
VVLLASCASYSGRGLVPGRSSAAEVQALMGAPTLRLPRAGGGEEWYYPRGGKMGWDTYAVEIGPDGLMRAIEQRLTAGNLARLKPGNATMKDAQALLGPPFEVSRFPRMKRTDWGYRVHEAPFWWIYWLQFSDDGVLREVIRLTDYEREGEAPFAGLH